MTDNLDVAAMCNLRIADWTALSLRALDRRYQGERATGFGGSTSEMNHHELEVLGVKTGHQYTATPTQSGMK